MGNFISNQRNRYRDGGIAFELELAESKEKSYVAGHAFLPLWVHKPTTKEGTLFTLVPAAADSSLMPQLRLSTEARFKMNQFLMDTRANLTGHREVMPYWMNSTR